MLEEAPARTRSTRVVILTSHYRITGEISLMAGVRLTDYLVEAKPFVAVTNATVDAGDGSKALTAQFLNVARDHIEAISPADRIVR